jgi:glycosyltransferase involved in cell wall biosynthesis
MRWNFFAPIHFERWSWENSITTGIGGSETSQVEMVWRLARRGHEVTSYAPIPDDCPGEWRGTSWRRFEDCRFEEPGLWILYRCPDAIERFDLTRTDQRRWLMMQDWDYSWKPEYMEHIERVMVLSQAHAKWLVEQRPFLADKMLVTGNGVKLDLIEQIEAEEGLPYRNPHRLMFASSPDRGLLPLLKVFRHVRELIPDLELHVFYGLNNIQKFVDLEQTSPLGRRWRTKAEEIARAVDHTPGVTWHGRVSQNQLYREWLQTGLMAYVSNFWETGYITGQEAQCLGAIPIVNNTWAQGEVCRHGVHIQGDAEGDRLVQARFGGAIARLALQPELQELIRAEMVPEARKRCDWKNYVDQWIEEAAHGPVL